MQEEKTRDVPLRTDSALPVGLTQEEVKQQIKAGHTNKTKKKSGKSYGDIVIDNLLTIFNMIYAVVSLVFLAFGLYTNMTFLLVVVPNVLLAIISEIRAP